MTEIMPVPRNLSFTVLPAGILVRPGFIERIVYIPFPGYTVKGLGIPGKLNAVCGCAVGHELSHTLFAMRYLPPTVCLADLPAHHAQHIRQSPRRQLGCFYGYGYRAPGNIFINQLYRLLPWDNLSRSAITDPHGLFSAFDGSPPKKNRL